MHRETTFPSLSISPRQFILVYSPLSYFLVPAPRAIFKFTVSIKSKAPATFEWTTDAFTATLNQLRKHVYANQPKLSTIRHIAIVRSNDNTLLQLESEKTCVLLSRTSLFKTASRQSLFVWEIDHGLFQSSCSRILAGFMAWTASSNLIKLGLFH